MTDEIVRFYFMISLNLTQFLMHTLKLIGFFFIGRQSCLEQVRYPSPSDIHARHAVTMYNRFYVDRDT